jgi:polyhydroxyalkanoate synthesis repressor PhaR
MKHIIRKYANRKLYDVGTRKYLTLGKIAQLLRRGEDIRVENYKTGEDVTSTVLAEVLLKQMKAVKGLLSVPLPLADMLRSVLSGTQNVARESYNLFLHIFEQSKEDAAESENRNITEKVQQALDDIEQEYTVTKEGIAELEHKIADLVLSRKSKKLDSTAF